MTYKKKYIPGQNNTNPHTAQTATMPSKSASGPKAPASMHYHTYPVNASISKRKLYMPVPSGSLRRNNDKARSGYPPGKK